MAAATTQNGVQDWLQLSEIDPELDELFKKMPGPPPQLGGTIPQLRQLLADAKQELLTKQGSLGSPSGVSEKDITIKARDEHSIPARIYTPESQNKSDTPVVVMLHGGGFCLGGLENEELNCRNFAQHLGAVCVNVDYRLAPEHPFPVPVNDCWDAVKWVAANASALKADPNKGFIVGGTSAGGNLSAVIGLLAREEELNPPLTGLLLMIPALVHESVVPDKYKPLYLSYEQNKDASILPVSAIDLFYENYKPDPTSPLFSPLLHPGGHGNLPPTYFQVCGMDPLRDEALVYEKILREDYGIKTKLDTYKGLPHGYWSFFPDLNVSKRFVEDTEKGVKWLLEQSR